MIVTVKYTPVCIMMFSAVKKVYSSKDVLWRDIIGVKTLFS